MSLPTIDTLVCPTTVELANDTVNIVFVPDILTSVICVLFGNAKLESVTYMPVPNAVYMSAVGIVIVVLVPVTPTIVAV